MDQWTKPLDFASNLDHVTLGLW